MAITLLPCPFACVAMVQCGYPLVQTLKKAGLWGGAWAYVDPTPSKKLCIFNSRHASGKHVNFIRTC